MYKTCLYCAFFGGFSRFLRVGVAFLASRGNLASSTFPISPAIRRSTASPGESGFLSSFLFPRRLPFPCFSGGILLPRPSLFPPQTAIFLLLRGNLASSTFPLSPADRHFPSPPGESGLLSPFLFPRRLPFHCFSGGIWLPRLFLFPPQSAVPLLLRGNLASSTFPISPAIRHSTASPGEIGNTAAWFTAAPAALRAVAFYAHRVLYKPSFADGFVGGLCNATSELLSREALPEAHRRNHGIKHCL